MPVRYCRTARFPEGLLRRRLRVRFLYCAAAKSNWGQVCDLLALSIDRRKRNFRRLQRQHRRNVDVEKPGRDQVVDLLRRPEGASITELMEKMGWQRHTVRGFMAGAMKKAGHRVESFKPEGGERSYRIAFQGMH